MKSAEPGRPYWERHAKNYERSMALFGRPLPRAMALVAEAVDGAGDVLEVGAGTGLFTQAIAPRVRRLVATDYSTAMVELLRERVSASGISNVESARADLYALAFEPGSFDVVVAANVLHLVPDLSGALAAFRRVLRSGASWSRRPSAMTRLGSPGSSLARWRSRDFPAFAVSPPPPCGRRSRARP